MLQLFGQADVAASAHHGGQFDPGDRAYPLVAARRGRVERVVIKWTNRAPAAVPAMALLMPLMSYTDTLNRVWLDHELIASLAEAQDLAAQAQAVNEQRLARL